MVHSNAAKNGKRVHYFYLWAVLLLLAAAALYPHFASAGAASDIIYVTVEGGGEKNGASWASSYSAGGLQTAVNEAGNTGHSVWVAKGVYPLSTTLTLKKGAKIYGGFTSGDASDTRDISAMMADPLSSAHATVLSPSTDVTEEEFRIISGGSGALSSDTVMDGFTIQSGDLSLAYENYNGGGMYNENSSPQITNCTFSGNKAGNGGGMYNKNSSPAITNCNFTGNKIAGEMEYYDGGAIYNNGGSPVITDCTFSRNSALSSGGAICSNKSSAVITNCTFSRNSAQAGGGIYSNGSSADISKCDFTANRARNGGAVYSTSAKQTLTGCTFLKNKSSSEGGAICNYNGTQTVANCIFSSNSASSEFSTVFGGAVYNDQTTQTIIKCSFSGNSAVSSGDSHSYGGAVYNTYSTQTVTNCTFSGNESTKFGGAVFNFRSVQTIVNSTFSGNKAELYGSALYNDRSKPVAVNSIFWNNETKDADVDKSIIGAVIMQNCAADNTYGGENNITDDPLLTAFDKNLQPTDVSTDIYICAIAEESPARANGLSVGVHTVASADVTIPSDDQLGNARPASASVDLGSYQLEEAKPTPTPISDDTGGSSGCSTGLPAILMLMVCAIPMVLRRK